MLPFRFGTDAEFAAVRDLLATSGFTTTGVCERYGVEEIYQFRSVGDGRTTGLEIRDSLDLLVRLFLDGLAVREAQVEAHLPPGGLDALLALQLLDRHPQAPDRWAARVRLYPTEGLHIASDLEPHAPGIADPAELEPADHVFSAITTLTGNFLDQVPETPCARFLELCAGTGIAALRAARRVEHAWATDIAERSVRFAEFNARLNGIENLQVVMGDLYQPVAGLTFDRIVAHPPYVPASETRLIYRDGGEDGEEVLRGILRGLPDHLDPGGGFYATCMTTDREGAPLEQRIREMLGAREAEFDVLLVTHYVLPPAEYYGRLAAAGRIPYGTAEQRLQLCRDLRVEQVVYCSMVLQRRATERAVFTVRRERTAAAGWRETEWLRAWSTTLAGADVLPALMEARPRLSPRARLQVTHRVEAGEWKVDGANLRVDLPFVRAVELSLTSARLLTLCDGDHTLREILQRLRDAGALEGEVSDRGFAEWIRDLVTEGMVILDDASPAQAEAAPAGLTSRRSG